MNHPLKTHISSPVICFLGKRKENKYFSKAPILIGGCARSGTSLLLSILSAHPRLFCFSRETDAFTLWEHSAKGLRPLRIDRMYRNLLLHRVPGEATRWCEKRPYNVRFISEILQYFGSEARFIHIVRDPRAVCTSRHPENPESYWVDPARWVQDVKSGLEHLHHPQVFTLRYEDLIMETEKQIRGICGFLGEECTGEILNWVEHAKVRSHDSWFGEITGIQKTPLESWKAQEHQARVEEVMKCPGVDELMEIIQNFTTTP